MDDVREYTCCFTGHRNIKPGEEQKILARVDNRLYPLIRQGVTYFGVGEAVGFDTLIAKHLLELRSTQFRKIKVVLVYPFDGFWDGWTEKQRRDFMTIRIRANKAVCVSDVPGDEAYFARDRRLVDGSKYCISYCHQATGGTAYTVRYALSKGLTVYNASSWDISQLRPMREPGEN